MKPRTKARLIRIAVVPLTAFYVACMFLVAGTTDLPMLWAYLSILGVVSIASILAMDDGLLLERVKPGPGGKDFVAVQVLKWALVFHIVVGALDVGRFHWSDSVPLALQVAGLAAFGGGLAFAVWAMTANPFFSSVVRLQGERGHRLITDGPYRWIRHPGYSGVVVCLLGSPLALGSWVSAPLALLCVAFILRRLLIEDRFLHERLEGYPDYARAVPWRLYPGVW